MRKVWWNGKFVDEKDAKVSIYDEAMLFGSCIFEMTRSFNKKQFKLKEHLERLFTGLKILRIEIPYDIEDLINIVEKVVEINEPHFKDDDEHRIMINVTRGLLGIYSEVGKIEPNVIIADFPLRWTVQNMGLLFDTGINAVIPSQRTIPARLLEPKIKNRSRIHYLMANIEVSSYQGDNNWALLLDEDGFITEGTGDNFFIVKDSVIITPEPRNILRGISREYIFQLCEELGLKCVEKNIEPYDVYTADEAFMTGTPFCMLPVTSLNSIKINDVEKYFVFKKLLNKWSRNVNLNIDYQIKSWNNPRKIGISPYQFKK